MKMPLVVPTSNGALQLEWHKGEKILELEVEDPATIHYLKWSPAEGLQDDDFFLIADTYKALDLIRWFTGIEANAWRTPTFIVVWRRMSESDALSSLSLVRLLFERQRSFSRHVKAEPATSYFPPEPGCNLMLGEIRWKRYSWGFADRLVLFKEARLCAQIVDLVWLAA